MDASTSLSVAHLLDAMGGSDRLWGKERVVAFLMREQRASGCIDPLLVTFSPCRLVDVMASEGFPVEVLSSRPTHDLDGTFGALGRVLARRPVAVVHSHGYRANIAARALRVTRRTGGARLISTCHGWVETTAKLRLYNAIDRWTSMLSDVTTVPDRRMLAALPAVTRGRHVLNAVPELDGEQALDAVPSFGAFVAGTLGRVSEAKGILDVLDVARQFPDRSVAFAIAGDGELASLVCDAGNNVRYVGYIAQPEAYLAALDVYVQASHSEGLSLALLEAMRAGKAIVATDVGATRDAVTDGESALIVPAGRPAALRDALMRLRDDPVLRAKLGDAARAAFDREFRIERQHERFLELYIAGGNGG